MRLLIALCAGAIGCAAQPQMAPTPAASPEPTQAATSTASEVYQVDTSTDADFVADLPVDVDVDVASDDAIPPILTVTGTPTYGIDMVDHERVDFWVDYLSGRGSKWFARWLARSTRYVPTFYRILDAHEVPRDLVFLAMVESGFSTSAYSWAHAAGPWQFMQSTGRAYGLRVDFWVDERRDFEAATDAAARHLRDLHARYGDWHLSFAAYNAGVGKVNNAIRRYGTEDFWEISNRRYLRRETKQYVPKILAAAKVAKAAPAYGFASLEYQAPLEWDVVTATSATSLRSFVEACPEEIDLDDMKRLNPALRAYVSPPGETWPIRIPKVRTATCAEALRAAPRTEGWVYRHHMLDQRDLDEVATAYRTTPEAILEFSGIERAQFVDFEEIVIPVPRTAAAAVPIRPAPQLAYRPPTYGPLGVRLVRYRVRSGDSLWKIAQRFHVSVSDLCKWNGLRRSAVLSVGRQLRLYQGPRRAVARVAKRAPSATTPPRPKPAPSGRTHVVSEGESWWSIANAHQVSMADLASLNGSTTKDVLQPGQSLRLPKASSAASKTARPTGGGYVVRDGESYWSIANDHGVSIQALQEANGLSSDDVLQPGQRLVIPSRDG